MTFSLCTCCLNLFDRSQRHLPGDKAAYKSRHAHETAILAFVPSKPLPRHLPQQAAEHGIAAFCHLTSHACVLIHLTVRICKLIGVHFLMHNCCALQEKQQAVEEAAQAALEASSAAEAQHAAASRQLATDKRNLQEQRDQVSPCLPACLPLSKLANHACSPAFPAATSTCLHACTTADIVCMYACLFYSLQLTLVIA